MESKFNIYPWIGYLLFAVIFGGILFAIFQIVFHGIKSLKKYIPIVRFYYFTMILTIFIVAASYIMNLGWIRVILTWIPIPIVHITVYIIANTQAFKKMHKSKLLQGFTVFSYITYMLTYLMLPDFGDTGGGCVFFGQITNDAFISAAFYISFISFILSIACIVTQFILASNIKLETTQQSH